MFRIKICGITTRADLSAAARLGADAIGINCYANSSRYVAPTSAANLQLETETRPTHSVGVFVNADPETIRTCIERFALTAIQLHGDEPPEFLPSLPDLPIIRARRMDDRGVDPITKDLQACKAAGRTPDALLVDAFSKDHYGGTGETVAWAELANYQQWLGEIPLILAGGLTPENVEEAIRTVRPHGVDTASGVESSPGVKDHGKMQSFIQQAKSAFTEL